LHFAVLEVEDLPDGQALTLETVVLNPAVGQAEGQLVGVADAVPAGEAVVAPQTAVAEAGLAAVEDRNLALVLVGDVEVEQARLQGLAEVTAEQPGVAVEVQAGVQAGDGQAAVGRGVELVAGNAASSGVAPVVQLEIVLGMRVLKGGLEEAPGPLQRQADAGFQVDARALGAFEATQSGVVPDLAAAQAALELHILGTIAKHQPTRIERQAP